MPLCFRDQDALGIVEHGRSKTDLELHGDSCRGRNAHGEFDLSGLQRGQRLRLGRVSVNGKSLRTAENGDGHGAADLASERGKIAVDVLSVPIFDALHRAAIKVARSFDRRERLRLCSGGRAIRGQEREVGQASETSAILPRGFQQTDGRKPRLPSIGDCFEARSRSCGPGSDQGVQLPEVGVPADAVGRGLTSAG